MAAEIEAPDADVAPLFAWHPTLRAIVEAGVEGRQGTIARDGAAARLSLGCYHVFGGDPASAGARRLVEAASGPRELVWCSTSRARGSTPSVPVASGRSWRRP